MIADSKSKHSRINIYTELKLSYTIIGTIQIDVVIKITETDRGLILNLVIVISTAMVQCERSVNVSRLFSLFMKQLLVS